VIRRRFLGLAHLVAFAALLPLLPACAATYDHTEITEVGNGDLNEEASSQALSIVVGDVLTANVVPFNSDDDPMIGDVRSEDPGIVTVLHTATGGYGFLGTSVGTVHLTLYADGAPVGGLEATVRVQDPAGP
jgi:hypothetical protein